MKLAELRKRLRAAAQSKVEPDAPACADRVVGAWQSDTIYDCEPERPAPMHTACRSTTYVLTCDVCDREFIAVARAIPRELALCPACERR